MPRPAALYNRRKWQLIGKSQWCCSVNCRHPLHALTYSWTRGMRLTNTLPLQSTTPGLHPVSIHQMAPPVRGSYHAITAYYSVYRPRKDERLSRPGWLVTYRKKVPPPGVEPGHITHPSTNLARRRVTLLIRPTQLPRRQLYLWVIGEMAMLVCHVRAVMHIRLSCCWQIRGTLNHFHASQALHVERLPKWGLHLLMSVNASR